MITSHTNNNLSYFSTTLIEYNYKLYLYIIYYYIVIIFIDFCVVDFYCRCKATIMNKETVIGFPFARYFNENISLLAFNDGLWGISTYTNHSPITIFTLKWKICCTLCQSYNISKSTGFMLIVLKANLKLTDVMKRKKWLEHLQIKE